MGLTTGEVLEALRDQNVPVSAGVLNQAPSSSAQAFDIGVQTQGRLRRPEEFEGIVVKAQPDGRVVRLGDVARVELGAQSYSTRGYLSGQPAIALPVFQTPGTNALTTAREIRETMDELAADFPRAWNMSSPTARHDSSSNRWTPWSPPSSRRLPSSCW